MKHKKNLPTYFTKKRIAVFCALAVLVLFCIAALCRFGEPLLRFLSSPQRFREWIDSLGMWGILAFLGVRCLQTVLPFLPAKAVEITAGYAFGSFGGLLLCAAGSMIGSSAAFLAARKLGVRLLHVFVSEEKLHSFDFLKSSQKLNLLVFILYVIPGTPKDTMPYLFGLTQVRYLSFLLLSTLGRIPNIVVATIDGDAVGAGRYGLAAAMFSLSIALGLLGVFLYRRISKQPPRENTKIEQKK